MKTAKDLAFPRLAPLIERCSIDNGIRRIRGIHPTLVFAKRQTVSAVNIALDNLRGEIAIDAHQERAVKIARPPESSGIKTAVAIGSAIIKAC